MEDNWVGTTEYLHPKGCRNVYVCLHFSNIEFPVSVVIQYFNWMDTHRMLPVTGDAKYYPKPDN